MRLKFFFIKTVVFLLITTFISSFLVIPEVYAQGFQLSEPRQLLGLSESYQPIILSGMTIYPDQPLEMDFIVDAGESFLEDDDFQAEAQKMINYFLTTLTVPDEEMWVNLSPYEENRIIADGLVQTEMGRDMLVQDYFLKQLSSSLMYPEGETGAQFWNKVYKKAQAEFGTVDIPANTFNKIWIVPEKASVHVHGNNVFVSNSRLKVMLEEDYLALDINQSRTNHGLGSVAENELYLMSEEMKNITRDIILPVIEREVNEGKTFANLRQIYNSMVLATWYKKKLTQTNFGKAYFNQNKLAGIDHAEEDVETKVYQTYIEAFKTGVYDYIREEYNPVTSEVKSKRYFSGGLENVEQVQESVTPNIILTKPFLFKANFVKLGNDNTDLNGTSDSAQISDVKQKIKKQMFQIENVLGLLTQEEIEKKFDDLIKNIESGKIKLKGEDLDILDGTEPQSKVIGQIDRKIAETVGYIHMTANAVVTFKDERGVEYWVIQQRVPQHSSGYRLTIPGGHLDVGESYDEGVERELMEEYSLDKLSNSPTFIDFDVYDVAGSMNRERRGLYKASLKGDDIKEIRKIKEMIDDKKSKMTEKEFNKWLVSEQQRQSGFGEVWALYFLTLDQLKEAKKDIKGLRYIETEDVFIDRRVTRKAYFSSTVLNRYLNDSDLLQKIVDTDNAVLYGGIDFDSKNLNLEELGDDAQLNQMFRDFDPAKFQNFRGFKVIIRDFEFLTPFQINGLLGRSDSTEDDWLEFYSYQILAKELEEVS